MCYRKFTCTNLKKHFGISHWKIYVQFQQIDEELKQEVRVKSQPAVAQTQLRQLYIEELVNRSKPYAFDHPQSNKMYCAIAEMVCVDSLPLSINDKPGFRCLLSLAIPLVH